VDPRNIRSHPPAADHKFQGLISGYIIAINGNMDVKTRKAYLIKSLVSLFVTLLGISAQGQMSCENIFSRPSVYKDSFLPLKKDNNSTEDLLAVLKTKPQELTSKELEAKIHDLQIFAEEYFNAAGISFEKLTTSVRIKNLKDAPEFTFFYSIYRITGSANGDEMSRLMNGVQANPKFLSHRLTIIFDPLYQVNYPDSAGHFLAATNSLFIGPHVIAREVAGLSTTFRHEIQHYLEQIKIINGEMTLARVVFWEMAPKDQEPYADYLRVDELETHLRDIRTLLNSQNLAAKDKKLSNVISANSLTGIKKIREPVLKEQIERLGKLINKSRTVTENIKATLNWDMAAINKRTGGIEISFHNLNSSYSNAKIELLGLIPPESIEDREKIKTALSNLIEWQKLRINQIETELKSLSKSE